MDCVQREGTIWEQMIELAIRDIRSLPLSDRRDERKRQKNAESAKRWIKHRKDENGMSLENCCAMLGLEAEAVRTMVLGKEKKDEKHRKVGSGSVATPALRSNDTGVVGDRGGTRVASPHP